MFALIPLRLTEEESYWARGRGLRLVRRFLEAVSAFPCFEGALAAGSNQALLQAAKEAGIATLDCHLDAKEDPPFLAPGGGALLERLARQGALPAELAVLNFRNPFLAEEDLREAMERFRETSSAVLASGVAARDHPCQLKVYYRVASAGLMALMESEAGAAAFWTSRTTQPGSGDWAVSRPLPMDWTGRGQPGPPGLYRREALALGCVYRPWTRDLATPDELWWKQNEAFGRLLLPPSCPGLLAGVPRGAPLPLEIREEGGQRILCLGEGFSGETGVVSLTPCAGGQARPEDMIELDFAAGDRELPLPGSFDLETPQALLYAVLEVVENGPFDFWDKYNAAPALWTKNNADAAALLFDGRAVTGRQDFPKAYRLDGSFVLLGRSAVGRIRDLDARERIAVQPLRSRGVYDAADPLDVCSLELEMEGQP